MHIERVFQIINLLDVPEKKRKFWPQRSIIVVSQDGQVLDVLQHSTEHWIEEAQRLLVYYPKTRMIAAQPGWYETVDKLKERLHQASEPPDEDTYVVGGDSRDVFSGS